MFYPSLSRGHKWWSATVEQDNRSLWYCDFPPSYVRNLEVHLDAKFWHDCSEIVERCFWRCPQRTMHRSKGQEATWMNHQAWVACDTREHRPPFVCLSFPCRISHFPAISALIGLGTLMLSVQTRSNILTALRSIWLCSCTAAKIVSLEWFQ